MKKNITIICSFSILINVFLLGMFISLFLFKPPISAPAHKEPRPGRMSSFDAAKTKLSLEGAEIVDRALEKHRQIMKENFHELKELMGQAEQLLVADELNKDALSETHVEMNKHNTFIKDALSQMIYDIAIQLSPEDRVLFFKHALPKHGPGGRGKGPERRGPPPPLHK